MPKHVLILGGKDDEHAVHVAAVERRDERTENAEEERPDYNLARPAGEWAL